MADDSGGLGGLLGWFGRPYDPQAAYEGLLSSQATQDALRARSLASVAQAFGAGAGSDARGSAIPFGATMGNAAAAAYGGQDELIKARLLAAQQQQSLATAGLEQGKLKMLPELLKAYQNPALYGQGDTKPAPGTPLARVSSGDGGETYWTPQGLAALRPTEGAYDQIHYPSGDPSTASGAYGFLDKTWREQAPKAGVDIEKYPRAYLAPPELQDKVAAITPISHWTGADAKGNPYNFRAQRLATNPAYVTGGAAPAEPRQAGGGGREPTPAETAIYAQTPGTVQNAARRAPTDSAFWNTAQPTGSLGAAPSSGAPLGPAVAPPTPPGGTPATSPAAARGLLDLPEVPSYSGALGGTPAAPSLPGQGAALIPRAAPGGQLGGLLDTQPDPVTARTMAALKSTAGAAPPGVNAAETGAGVGGLLNQGAVAAAAPPADPRLAALARVAGPGAAEPGGLLGGGSLQHTIDQAAGATVPPVTQGGGLLPQAPVPPQAPLPAAPPAAPPAVAVPPPAAPGAPTMPPGGIPLPALPPMPTLPAAPQMPNIPIPPVAAGTQQEQIAQNIAGISTLVGMPAPPWIQDLAKMPATRATELYKGYVTAATNQMNEQYKTQLNAATARYIAYEQSQGNLPADLTKTTEEQRLRLRNDMRKQGVIINPDGSSSIDPQYLELEGKKAQQASDIKVKEQQAIAEHAAGLRTGEKGQELILTDLVNKKLPEANDAVRSLEGVAQARALLDQGIITGFGAPAKVQFGKALQAIGINYNKDPVTNTEAYIAARAGEVGRAVKPLGTGSGVSENDRRYAEGMVGGNIEYSEQSLRRILDDAEKAHHTTIDNFNYDLARRAPSLVPALTVKKPEAPASAHPAGGYEFDRATGTMKPRTNPQ